MIDIHLERLTRRFGAVVAVDDLTLDIGGGAVTALLGPSGCGKTTILRLVAGLLTPTAGRVRFGDHDVTHVPPERREAVMVFQDPRLFPHLSAIDNVAFGLRMRGVARNDRRRAARATLERVGLEGLDERRPGQLSGGQRQRVALARALVLEPSILLLDEPLANLDAHLRQGMRELILDVQREQDLTTVVVTHDQEEAVVLSEDVALLFDGRLHQHGAPRTFFEHPATERTARFFGAANLVAGRRHGDHVETPLGRLRVPDGAPGGPDVWLTIRPERLVVGDAHATEGQHVQGMVVSSAFLGTRTRATVEVAGVRLMVDVADDALADVGPGTLLTLRLPAEALWTVPREATAGRRSPAAEEFGPVTAGADGTISSPPDPRTRP